MGKDGAVMRNGNLQTKRLVQTCGEVQFPIKIGARAYYRRGNCLIWTDKVKRILEIAADYVRLETMDYYYIIEREGADAAAMKAVA